MNVPELNFLGCPVATIPYVTPCLLKLHGRIATVFNPFDVSENRLWSLAKRIALVFSTLFVYPGLGILTLIGCISAKFNLKKKVENALNALINEELDSVKSSFKNVSVNNNYYWFVEANLSPINESLSLNDFRGSYKYLEANIASNQENYLMFLDTFENYARETLSGVNPNKFQFMFKFIIVEKNTDGNFNIYAYDKKIQYQNGCKQRDGGFQSSTLVPTEAADNFLKKELQVDCRFSQI